jgi:chemosensory pili system protein ChpE
VIFRDARSSVSPAPVPARNPLLRRGDLAVGALLSLTNPYALPFWVGVAGSLFASVPGKPHGVHVAVFLAAFLAATVSWCFLIAGLVAWGRRLLSAAFFRWVSLACGTALCLFAIRLGWQLVHGI